MCGDTGYLILKVAGRGVWRRWQQQPGRDTASGGSAGLVCLEALTFSAGAGAVPGSSLLCTPICDFRSEPSHHSGSDSRMWGTGGCRGRDVHILVGSGACRRYHIQVLLVVGSSTVVVCYGVVGCGGVLMMESHSGIIVSCRHSGVVMVGGCSA